MIPAPTFTELQVQQWRPGLYGPPGDDLLCFYAGVAEVLPTNCECVEIGVCYGRSLLFLCDQLLQHRKVYARVWGVDTWNDPPPTDAGGGCGILHRWILESLILHRRGTELELLHLIRADSVRAARLFDDGSLDLVLIDGDHTLEGVRRDIAAWKPKVKPGGILAGHDYCEKCPGVWAAVNELGDPRMQLFGSVWAVQTPGGQPGRGEEAG